MSNLRVYPDVESLIQAAAEHVTDCATTAIAEKGYFSIALSVRHGQHRSNPNPSSRTPCACVLVRSSQVGWSRLQGESGVELGWE